MAESTEKEIDREQRVILKNLEIRRRFPDKIYLSQLTDHEVDILREILNKYRE